MTPNSSRTVAVIGAGTERRKFGNKSVRAHLAAGYTVYPVHPTASTVEGLTAYPNLPAIRTSRLDRVTLYVPPAVAMGLLPEIAAANPGEVWFNPGVDRPDVVAKARELGLNVVVGCSIVNLGLSPAMFPDE